MRYPGAIWRGSASVNYSTELIAHRFVIVHVAQGDGSLSPWFHDPEAHVSAHLWNPKEGPLEQYVDLDYEAFAEMAYNGESISIEHEGYSGERLTHGQVQRLRLLAHFAWREWHIPPVWRKDALGLRGWTSHAALGWDGGDHPGCPGPGIVADVRALLRTVAW